MIRKLAEELATNPTLSGSEADNPAPMGEPAAPSVKTDATPDPQFGFTGHSGDKHRQTMHRFLGRALGQYDAAGQQHEDMLTKVLGAQVKHISGSSATSQRAMKRFKNRSS